MIHAARASHVALAHFILVLASLASLPACASAPDLLDAHDEVVSRLAAGSPALTPLGEPTALERYVRRDDGAFAWTLESSTRVEGSTPGTWHAIRMTSQVWRVAGEVDLPTWTHWVCIWLPDTLVSDRPILFIGGGRRKAEVPAKPPNELQMFAAAGAIIVTIDNVPNQPMRLGDDPAERNEDGLVARTWLRAMETGDPTWIARFPMVKAAVRAMDTAEQFVAKHPPTHATLKGKPVAAGFTLGHFLVAGGSKRGWTTWLTSAIDPRVGALVPFVIDVLDLPSQMRHHHDAYGFWSEALNDYVETDLVDRFDSTGHQVDPPLAAVLAHDDPVNWLSRVGDRPKLLINASGDEFFLPDSSGFYQDRLPQPWRLRYEANCGHNLKDSPAVLDLVAFYRTWAAGGPLPELTWTVTPDGTRLKIDIRSSAPAAKVLVWQADNEKARDFRFPIVGKVWTSREVVPKDARVFGVLIDPPAAGFRAVFVEVSYPPLGPGVPPLTFTTQVYVLPDVLPHAKQLGR